MEFVNGFVDALLGLFYDSGIMYLTWQNYVMIGISFILLFLAIKKQYEPLLLLPIAFGMLLVNLYPDIMAAPSTNMVEVTEYLKTHATIDYPVTTLNSVNRIQCSNRIVYCSMCFKIFCHFNHIC